MHVLKMTNLIQNPTSTTWTLFDTILLSGKCFLCYPLGKTFVFVSNCVLLSALWFIVKQVIFLSRWLVCKYFTFLLIKETTSFAKYHYRFYDTQTILLGVSH